MERGRGGKIALGVGVGLAVAVSAAVAQVQPTPPKPAAGAAKPDPKAVEFFETKIRPLLAQKCFACHNDKNTKGGLRMDTAAGFFKGGDSGNLVTPGHPEMSLLLDVVSYNKDLKMPPQGKLKPQEIADLTAWVQMGAPWPNAQIPAQPAGGPGGPLFTAEQKKFWAFQPVKDPVVPKVKNPAWVQSPIDAFILARLEAKGLKPAPKADRRTLIRRVTFDLTGLPPTPDEVDAFLKDTSPSAWSKVIDRLLASKAYGERWGRHWLDVARYADSNGLDENTAFGNAWRYRDYVVNAINADKPYDQFLREQIAGDLLPASEDESVNAERLTATGYLVLGPKVLAEPDKQKMVMDIVDEQIDTVGKSVMGLTLGCARCHDHKFDPLPTRDYYGLAGIFKSTRTMETLNTVAKALERPIADAATVERSRAHKAQLEAAEEELRGAENRASMDATSALVGQLQKYLVAIPEVDPRSLRVDGSVDLNRPGAVVLEAEKFKKADVQVSTTGYGEGIGILESAGRANAFAEYEVEVAQAGEYELAVRYASGEPRPIKLLLDGALVKPDAAGKATGGFNPPNQVWESAAVVSLAAGKHVLRMVQSRSSLPHIDKFALVPVAGAGGPGAPVNFNEFARSRGLDSQVLRRAAGYLRAGRPNDPIWGAWSAFASLNASDFVAGAQKLQAEWQASGKPKSWNPLVAEAFAGEAPKSLAEVAERYQKLFQRVNDAWNRQLQASKKQPTRLGDSNLEGLRQALYAERGAFGFSRVDHLYPATVTASVRQFRQKVTDLKANAPAPAAMVLAVEEAKDIADVPVHIRGNHLALGEPAPRIFPRVIAGEKQQPVTGSRSGRLEFAEWLTRPDHPLTARVMANRVWYHHFGEGIVRSTDNFGKLGDRPSHPELLDWLSRRFVEKGWSLKAMHRMILQSNTYQMSTAHDARAALADPENRLLWRFHRRRLQVEAIRDSMLAVAGTLDPTMGGSLLKTPNFGYVTNDQSGNGAQYDAPRRSIYLPVIRNAVFDVFQVFDFVEPSFTNGNRATTTVAPQALFMLNGEFVQNQAEAFAKSLFQMPGDDAERIRAAYLRALGRPATAVEVTEALDYLKSYDARLASLVSDAEKRRLTTWRSFCQILFASNEFVVLN